MCLSEEVEKALKKEGEREEKRTKVEKSGGGGWSAWEGSIVGELSSGSESRRGGAAHGEQ